MQSAVLVVAVGILALIAYGDVRMRRIPNALSLTIATLGLAHLALAHDAAAASLAAATVARDQFRLLYWRPSRLARLPPSTEAAGSITAPAESTVPYGVAIAAAGVITLILGTSLAR